MDRDQLHSSLEAALRTVAPEVDPAEVDPDDDLLDAFELDSMDLLSLVGELHERTGVDVPESDYRELSSMNATVDYLERSLTR